MEQQFTVLIERDPESGWLADSVAELPGCYTQAPDMTSPETNMSEAIQVHLGYGERDELRTYRPLMLVYARQASALRHWGTDQVPRPEDHPRTKRSL